LALDSGEPPQFVVQITRLAAKLIQAPDALAELLASPRKARALLHHRRMGGGDLPVRQRLRRELVGPRPHPPYEQPLTSDL
jgi:hypothetical protein